MKDKIHHIKEHGTNSDEYNSDGEEYEEPFDDSGSSVHFTDESDSDGSVRSEIFNLKLTNLRGIL